MTTQYKKVKQFEYKLELGSLFKLIGNSWLHVHKTSVSCNRDIKKAIKEYENNIIFD